MNPEITYVPEFKIVGMSSKMKHGEMHKIIDLWKRFRPSQHEITNNVSYHVLALQVFPKNYKTNINKDFEIWAGVQVEDYNEVPEIMNNITIPSGLYAVFLHKGMDASNTYQKIMSEWLPNSDYSLDDRPHFQMMGKNYKNGSPDSEEDFYIPIKPNHKN
ncbi:MAG: GyrI-like domain-containing protein [Winogradskyella sp.]|uniref:GyrI-like domain-containing protein n=1 Tax=Winogradskyella sp. TaxID=1883156 RepID=UPI001851A8B2|nr:GyrI-like domain-containing protein [Winogradskyella sp.]